MNGGRLGAKGIVEEGLPAVPPIEGNVVLPGSEKLTSGVSMPSSRVMRKLFGEIETVSPSWTRLVHGLAGSHERLADDEALLGGLQAFGIAPSVHPRLSRNDRSGGFRSVAPGELRSERSGWTTRRDAASSSRLNMLGTRCRIGSGPSSGRVVRSSVSRSRQAAWSLAQTAASRRCSAALRRLRMVPTWWANCTPSSTRDTPATRLARRSWASSRAR